MARHRSDPADIAASILRRKPPYPVMRQRIAHRLKTPNVSMSATLTDIARAAVIYFVMAGARGS